MLRSHTIDIRIAIAILVNRHFSTLCFDKDCTRYPAQKCLFFVCDFSACDEGRSSVSRGETSDTCLEKYQIMIAMNPQ